MKNKILVAGQLVKFQIKFRILQAFAYKGGIYYLAMAEKHGTPLNNHKKMLFGVLNVDKSCDEIPDKVWERAAQLIKQIDPGELE